MFSHSFLQHNSTVAGVGFRLDKKGAQSDFGRLGPANLLLLTFNASINENNSTSNDIIHGMLAPILCTLKSFVGLADIVYSP